MFMIMMMHCRLLLRFCAFSCIAILAMVDASAQSTPKEKNNPAAINTTAPNDLHIAQAQATTETEAKTKREAQLAARQKLITNASELIKSGRPKEAYALLSPYQSIMAGDADYDYVLGIAALDSGKINEAIFALERVLAVRPSHLQARAEIARAYLAAGEVAASKQEFETVQQQNPPKEVSANIQKYLDIIETARSTQKTTVRGYIEAMIGEDSNVNTATSNRQVAIPFFGGVLMTLNAAGIASRDTFGSVGTGFSIRHALTPAWAIIGGANYNQRNNSTQQTLNTGNGDVNFGVNLNDGNDNYMALLQAQTFVLDNTSYRNATGLTTQWQRNLNSGSQLSSYLQYSSLSYPNQQTRDADRYVLGGAYATSLSGEYAPVVYTGLYLGAEQPLESNVTYLANNFYGVRLGGEIKLGEQYTLLASASMEKRMHEGADTLFLVKRNDTQSDLKISMNYMPAQKWTITPAVSYTNNESNIIINKYERTVLSLSARRDFN